MERIATLAERLNEYRKDHYEMTYADLEKLTGVPAQTLNRYALGKRIPRINDAAELAAALHVHPLWLQGYDVDKHLAPNIIPIQKIHRAPLIGQIACGTPIMAEQNIEDYIPYPDYIHADFCLRCVGDSMEGCGIYNGDIVFIRAQPDVEDGEIAAVQFLDADMAEATLKRIYHGKEKLTLAPENPKYQPKSYEGNALNSIQIVGKAVWYLSKVK